MRVALAALVVVFATAVPAGTRSALTNDRNLETAKAYIEKHCHWPVGPLYSDLWETGTAVNVLYGNCGGNHAELAWFFYGPYYVSKDTERESADVRGVWRNDRTVALLYVLYRQSDSTCCLTGGGKIVRFEWNGHRMVRLDPMPQWSATATQPGRYP